VAGGAFSGQPSAPSFLKQPAASPLFYASAKSERARKPGPVCPCRADRSMWYRQARIRIFSGWTLIYEPMLVVDPPGPAPGEFVPERFGPADPLKWIALCFSDQANQSKRFAHVPAPPTRRDRRRRRYQIPSFSIAASSGIPSWRSLAARRRAFMLSDRRRYAVSRSDSISCQSSIGTMTAVGSPRSLETIWISALTMLQVYSALKARWLHARRRRASGLAHMRLDDRRPAVPPARLETCADRASRDRLAAAKFVF